MLTQELLNDLDCAACGTPMKGRSPVLLVGEPYQSIGRTVIVTKQTTEGIRASRKLISHDEAHCFACSHTLSDVRMSPDSWRPSSPVTGVVARSPKKRKSRAKKKA